MLKDTIFYKPAHNLIYLKDSFSILLSPYSLYKTLIELFRITFILLLREETKSRRLILNALSASQTLKFEGGMSTEM